MTTHLNDIQKLCTNLESDTELVLGEIYGMRQWNFYQGHNEELPRLMGHYSHRWSITETNTASCGIKERNPRIWRDFLPNDTKSPNERIEEGIQTLFTKFPDAVSADVSIIVYPQPDTDEERIMLIDTVHRSPSGEYTSPWDVYWSSPSTVSIMGVPGKAQFGNVDIRITATIPVPEHTVTDTICTCGIYAYTDPKSLEDNSSYSTCAMFGIIKAWGKVTVGTKGFRAEHAKIIGLTPILTKWYDELVTSDPLLRPKEWELAIPAPDENLLIPDDFPRYDSYDDMLKAYQKLTEGPPI